jgi:hypothetical protein
VDSEAVERLVGELVETRRHFDVVSEGLRGEIRQVADGVAGVTSGLQHLRSEVKEEFTELRSLIRLSYAELDRRVQTLEQAVLALEARVERLESVA